VRRLFPPQVLSRLSDLLPVRRQLSSLALRSRHPPLVSSDFPQSSPCCFSVVFRQRAVADRSYFVDYVCYFGQTLNTKVVDLFNTFPERIYSLILVEYSGSYYYWKFAVRFCEFQYSVNVFSLGGRLRLLKGRICLRLYRRCCSMFLDLPIECSYAFIR
jgi:hypothetical protein